MVGRINPPFKSIQFAIRLLIRTIISFPFDLFFFAIGLATAAGCQLAVSGDLILATKKTRFSTPGSNFGLFCFNPSIALYRRTNFNLTAFLTLTGQSITAQGF